MFKVIICEDEKLLRKELALMTDWGKYDCKVVGEAANGIEGKKIIIKLKPDIVITDIRMPGLDGLNMLKELEKELKASCIIEYIIISGYNDFNYAREAIKLGVKNYLLKPFDDKELYQTIQKIINEIREKKKNEKFVKNLAQINDSKIMLFKEHLIQNKENTKEFYIKDVIEYIEENYNKDISITDAANNVYISASYLCKLFKEETNYSFLEYLTNYRIKKAIELLEDKTFKIHEIAELVGYKDPRYFSSIFKKYVGISPGEFKDGLK